MTVEGLPGIKVVGVEQPIAIGGASLRLIPVRLQAPAESGKPGANRIEFVIDAVGDAKRRVAREIDVPLPALIQPDR